MSKLETENLKVKSIIMIKRNIISAFIILSSYSLFAGGPWTKPTGGGYFKLSEWWTVFDHHYTDQGIKDPNVTTGIFNTSIYAEYGITDRFTTIVDGVLFSRNYMNNLRSGTTNDIIVAGEAINTIGDINVGFKYGLTKPGSRVPIALTLVLGIPSGKSVGGTLNNLQTGDGEFNQILQLDAGTGFNLGSNSGYVSSYIGVNNRSKDFSEEFRYGIEIGLGLLDSKLWISGKLNAVESFKNGATAETITSTSIFANNSEFVSIGVEANWYITEKFGISAGVAGAIRGEIIAAAPSYSFGVFYDMK